VANSPPTKDCTAAMGYCMTIDHDTRASMSPQPPQDGRWAIFVPASYKNMALGEAELSDGESEGKLQADSRGGVCDEPLRILGQEAKN
jgi:hypothetical protein